MIFAVSQEERDGNRRFEQHRRPHCRACETGMCFAVGLGEERVEDYLDEPDDPDHHQRRPEVG